MCDSAQNRDSSPADSGPGPAPRAAAGRCDDRARRLPVARAEHGGGGRGGRRRKARAVHGVFHPHRTGVGVVAARTSAWAGADPRRHARRPDRAGPTRAYAATVSAFLRVVLENPARWRLILTVPESAPREYRDDLRRARSAILAQTEQLAKAGIALDPRLADLDPCCSATPCCPSPKCSAGWRLTTRKPARVSGWRRTRLVRWSWCAASCRRPDRARCF